MKQIKPIWKRGIVEQAEEILLRYNDFKISGGGNIMHAWESIQKALDYIEDNLAQSYSPEELSKVAALSPFYFSNFFRGLFLTTTYLSSFLSSSRYS